MCVFSPDVLLEVVQHWVDEGGICFPPQLLPGVPGDFLHTPPAHCHILTPPPDHTHYPPPPPPDTGPAGSEVIHTLQVCYEDDIKLGQSDILSIYTIQDIIPIPSDVKYVLAK